MGKWAEVDCSCPNRVPLPLGEGSDQPFRGKRRLTKDQRDAVEKWKSDREGMYECGHRDGLIVELWPGNIIILGRLIERAFGQDDNTFEIFMKIGDWRNYEDELLEVSPQECRLWLMEIDELRNAFEAKACIPLNKVVRIVHEFLLHEQGIRGDIVSRAEAAAQRIPWAMTNKLRRMAEEIERPSLQTVERDIETALTNATTLCRASIETGNPVRLLL